MGKAARAIVLNGTKAEAGAGRGGGGGVQQSGAVYSFQFGHGKKMASPATSS